MLVLYPVFGVLTFVAFWALLLLLTVFVALVVTYIAAGVVIYGAIQGGGRVCGGHLWIWVCVSFYVLIVTAVPRETEVWAPCFSFYLNCIVDLFFSSKV